LCALRNLIAVVNDVAVVNYRFCDQAAKEMSGTREALQRYVGNNLHRVKKRFH